MKKKAESSFKRSSEREPGYKKESRGRSETSGKKPFDREKREKRSGDGGPKSGFKRGDLATETGDRKTRGFAGKDAKPAFPQRRKRDNEETGERKFTPRKRDEKFEKPERSAKPQRSGDRKGFAGKEEKPAFPQRRKRDNEETGQRKFTPRKRDENFEKPERFGDRKNKGFGGKEEKPPYPQQRKRDHDEPGQKKFTPRKREEPFEKPERSEKPERFGDRRKQFANKEQQKRTFEKKPFKKANEEESLRKVYPQVEEKAIDTPMTLNKYIAHSGECSRRDAAEFVKQGKVKVNGELVLEPGYRIVPGDQVTLLGKKLTPQKGLVYILINKPKGFITTTEDPEERKTVMDLVSNAGVDRLFPVGRLDRNTTGVLLLTNDGTLAHKLSHPSYNIKKVYHVTLDKNLTRADYEKIVKGVELEDGKAEVDELAYLENRNELGLEIHSGRNRIVRRIFESLGYNVDKLDRVMYAGLTKKNVSRGKWRFLTEREIVLLKHFKS